MAELTPFGKYMKKYRVNTGMKLKEMADRLNTSSARLSAIEHGKITISDNLVTSISDTFSLSGRQRYDLRRAQLQSQNTYQMDFSDMNPEYKKVLIEFLIEHDHFDTESWTRIQQTVNRSLRMKEKNIR